MSMRAPSLPVAAAIVATMLLAVGVAIVFAEVCANDCAFEEVACIRDEGLFEMYCTLAGPDCLCTCGLEQEEPLVNQCGRTMCTVELFSYNSQ